MRVATTIGLLCLSNMFMTVAWYGHLRFKQVPIWQAILVSWGLAFFEYTLQVPANRIGFKVLDGYQLKIIQEIITLCVFIVFATFVLKEDITLRYGISFFLILSAAAVAFYR